MAFLKWLHRPDSAQPADSTESEEDKLLRSEIAELRSRARRGFIQTAKIGCNVDIGLHPSLVVGPHIEIDGPRQLQEGEPPLRLIQRVLATTGERVIFETNPDNTIPISILMDVNRTLDFGGITRHSKIQLGALTAATIMESADSAGDPVAYIAYANNSVARCVPFSGSAINATRILRTALRPPPSSGTLESGLDKAIAKTVSWNERSLRVIVSDCLNLTPKQCEAIKRLARQHLVRVVVIFDPREQQLPDTFGLLPVFDLRSQKRAYWWLNARNKAIYAEDFRRHMEELKEFFESKPYVPFEFVSTEDPNKAMRQVLKLLASKR